jgi:hypothetical protein
MITGPDHILQDEQGIYYGTYTFTATVSCGTPPYTYKWINLKGSPSPIFEGSQYSTVKIPVSKLGTNPLEWGVWLTVTDSAGREALWMRNNGLGNSHEFLYLLRADPVDKNGWTKITEPATFSSAAGCAQGGQSASGGGNSGSSSSGGGELPLVPIAAGVGVVAVAGIAGAKILSGRSASGGGGTDPGTPPDTTRTWTDGTGRERTATLQPDGQWISDQGTVVDLGKTGDARRDAERDQNWNQAEHEKQGAADTAKADADRKELENIRAKTDEAVKKVHDTQWEDAKKQRDADESNADMWKKTADRLDSGVSGGEWVVTGADFGVNVLEKVTGPAGTAIKTGYTIGKDLGKNMSGSYQKGESLWKGAAKGGLEAGFDLGFDKAKKMLPSGPGNWNWKTESWNNQLKGATGALPALGIATKNAVQSAAVKLAVKDPIKDLAKKGFDKLGSPVGKFK